ncbi:MAG: DNA repair protein RecN [Saprospiraceae bacterium]|nr:DNA repair protein RecN [Saprospiraceae bacterium]
MIKNLHIKNYGLIEEISIDFSPKLNIITGETGSGKSMLLGAIGLILGNRADAKMVRDPAKKCIIEGTFSLDQEIPSPLGEDLDLQGADELVIRRELSATGKSRIFANDALATLKQIQTLCQSLVDLHQQFENLGINNNLVQMQILDAVAGSEKANAQYRTIYREWTEMKVALEQARQEQSALLRERDYLQFQVAEFEEVAIDPASDKLLEDSVRQAEQSDDMSSALREVGFAFDGDESSLIPRLKTLISRLRAFNSFSNIQKLEERLEAVLIEITDLQAEVENVSEHIVVDPEQLQQWQSRLDLLNRLMHKHGAKEIDDLADIAEQMQDRLAGMDAIDADIAKYEKEVERLEKELERAAKTLRAKRQKAMPGFEKNVNALLADLRMEGARFHVLLEPQIYRSNGADAIEFQFSGNAGSALAPLKQTASGGELSRIALVIKSLIAEKIALPTLIFDEIDSGVSGDVAKRMGSIFKQMAQRHQIISITHSPQVAARADAHFRVFKESKASSASSHIALLDSDQSIEEIATMLSSSPPSAKAMASARELIQSE